MLFQNGGGLLIPRSQTIFQCVSLFYVIDTGSIRPRARIPGTELGVTYLPFAFSSDASCADLPLPLLGAPVDIEALVKLGCASVLSV